MMKHSNNGDTILRYKPDPTMKHSDLVMRHLRNMKDVQRLAGVRTIKPYSLAEHCYYTGLLFEDLALEAGIPITRPEIYFVYRHDVLETVTGDLLLPAKSYNDVTKESWAAIEDTLVQGPYSYLENLTDEHAKANYFTADAWTLFKACDLYELYLFCVEERELGNRSEGVLQVIHNCEHLLPRFNIRPIKMRIRKEQTVWR